MYVFNPYLAMSLLTAYSAAALEELEQPQTRDEEPGLPRSSIQPTDSLDHSVTLGELTSKGDCDCSPKYGHVRLLGDSLIPYTKGASPTTAPNFNYCILSHLLCFLKSRKDTPKSLAF